MPVLLAPLIAVAFGLALSQRRRGALGAQGWAEARACTATFAALVVLPALLVLSLEQPAWALLHASPVAPIAALVGASLIAAALVVVGQRLGEPLAQARGSTALAVIAAPLVTLLAVALVERRALLSLGAGIGGKPVPLAGSGFDVVVAAVDVLVAIGFALTARAIDKLR